MKFFALIETAPGANTYQIAGREIVTDSTSEAVVIAETLADPGCRTGIWPYNDGLPFSSPATQGEVGKTYHVLSQPDGASGLFAPDGQVLASTRIDTAGAAQVLGRFYNYRIGLIPTDARPAPDAQPAPASSGSASSGSASASSTSGGSAPPPQSSGGSTTVSSGGTATTGG